MSRRTYSSNNSWAQNISAIMHRTQANLASIRQDVPTALVSPSTVYSKQYPATQRVYHYAPQFSYSGGRWAQPVIHTEQRCYTPNIKGMSHVQDNCPECAHPMTEMSGQGPQHNRSYFTLQQQPSRPFTERPEDIDSTSHIFVRNVIDSEIDARARSVASFKQNTIEEPEHPVEKTPLKGILRQSVFSEKAAAKSNLESMAQIFNKLQDLKFEQQSVVDKYQIGQKGLRNELLDLRNDIELNQMQKIEDKITDLKTEYKKDQRGVENKIISLERAMNELKLDIDSKLDTEFHRALADFQSKSGEERIKLRRDILDVIEDKVGSSEQKQLLNHKDNESTNTQLKQKIKRLEESMAQQVQENHRNAMDKIEMIRVEMETRGIKEATTITSEKEETMNEIEALKREIARLNKKVTTNNKPVRDEIALSKMDDFEERLMALEKDHLKRQRVIKDQAKQTEKQLRSLIEQQAERIAELENRNEAVVGGGPPEDKLAIPDRMTLSPNKWKSPVQQKSAKKKFDPVGEIETGGDVFDEPEPIQRKTKLEKPKTNAVQSRGIYNVPEESFGYQESEEPYQPEKAVESQIEEEQFNFNQDPLQASVECQDHQSQQSLGRKSKPESQQAVVQKEQSEKEEDSKAEDDWDFDQEFDDIFDGISPQKRESKINESSQMKEESEENSTHPPRRPSPLQDVFDIQERPIIREEQKQSRVEGALELNSDFDDTDGEETGTKNPLESGILGKPTDRLEDIGTSEIHISQLADDDEEIGEKLRDEEDAVIQESKQLVEGIHQRYESGEQEETEPEIKQCDNREAVKIQGQLDFDTDEEDSEQEEEDLGVEGVELEVTPLYEERKSQIIKEEDSTHLEHDCSQLVSEIDEWITVEEVKSQRSPLQASPQVPVKSERSKVKFQGALDAGSSFEEEDSKFDPQMDATMSWGDLDRRDSELEQTQSQAPEDEEQMDQVAKHILQEEVDAILQIVEARRKF